MWFFGLIVVLLIGAVAVVASGRWGAMGPAYDDRPDMSVPARQALTSDDIETARFGVGLRGYRMDEVDTLLERVAREVAERDRRIADLERAITPIVHGPEGAGFTSRHTYDSDEFDDTGYQKPILVGGDFPEPTTTTPAEPAEAEPVPEAAQASESATPADGESELGGPPQAEAQGQAAVDEPVHLPPPPLIQSLLEEARQQAGGGEAEAESWFQAKEPPPDHSASPESPENAQHTPNGQAAEASEYGPTVEGSESGSNGQGPQDEGDEEPARGRHSAAPDVNVVQRPS
jgi:DivIVA domain-containing protein